MAERRLIVRGVVDTATTRQVDLGPLAGVFRGAPTYRDTIRFESDARGESVGDHSIEYREDDLIEVRYADGARRYMRAERMAEEFGVAPSRGSRDRVIRADAFESQAERGVVKHAVKGLAVLGIDLPNLAGKKLADFIAEKVEGASGRTPGLYRVAYRGASSAPAEAPEMQPVAVADIPADVPILVFLHGTASSFIGSFGDLWRVGDSERSDSRAARWASDRVSRWLRFVAEAYGDHVYALEHRSLSQSPIANAISLLEKLPVAAHLHLVSHSRGGLVGELIARGHPSESAGAHEQPFTKAELARFKNDPRPGRDQQLKELDTLAQLLAQRKPNVERFVRVAAPARGTTLADGKLDDWLSGFTSLLERFLPLSESDLFYVAKAVLLATVKQKADPSILPGIEAMMTDSPLIGLLNGGPKVGADLSVLAGDTDATGWIPWMWPVDRFFQSTHFPEGRNDLVVPTLSMVRGLRRDRGRARRFEVSGSDINHFRYFSNAKTFDRLVAALAWRGGAPAGFVALERPVRAARSVRALPGPRPRVLLIPGISGSHIKVGGERIWLAIHELLLGNIVSLDVHGSGDPAQAGTGPDAIIERFYGDLADFLSATHKVVEFPYDWRIALHESAKRLDEWVRRQLEDPEHAGQPVRILAHSMGGLLTRVWKARHPHTWTRFAEHPDARVLMLGTPSRGSMSIPRLLLGRDELIGQLSLLDPFHGRQDLLQIFRRLPGILALLPQNTADFDFSSVDTWRRLQRADGGDWPLPDTNDLRALADDWSSLDDAVSLDVKRMLYVAGRAEATPVDIEVHDSGSDRGVRFIASPNGDGRVAWSDGIPQPLRDAGKVWWMNAVHGDLCRHEPAFLAIQELLQAGETQRLARTPPSVVRGVDGIDERFEYPDARIVVFPDETMLLNTMLGSEGKPPVGAVERLDVPVVRVGVSHGNLHHETSRPILVGHYGGHGLVSAERALDRKLGHRLSEIHRLGIYPGAVGQSEVVLVGRTGAIVIGLGEMGELSPRSLKLAVRDGLLRYARARVETDRGADGIGASPQQGLSVASVLVGSGSIDVSVGESIRSVLEAVIDANAALARQQLPVRICDLQFLELYEDLAITGAKTLQSLSTVAQWQSHFAFETRLHEGGSGWRRGNFDDDVEWWRDIQVNEQTDGSLRYSLPTDRARVEIHSQHTQRALLDGFVRDATQLTARDPELEQTLFELLLPNQLKDHATDERPVMLRLDATTARYPWEMLSDFRAVGLGADHTRPLAVRQRVLRRYSLEGFRTRPVLGNGSGALVIGNPPSEFPDLPGAEAEARAVAEQLNASGFDVASELGPDATPTRVVKRLYSGNYRVLHLAGHGVYEYPLGDGERHGSVTGMVLGQGVFLSAVEIEQMRVVPQLVFINCCSLGRIEPARRAHDPALVIERSAFAANLATQFMKMGAIAVVAAGWEVEDAAAKSFATTFYQRMLDGENFGHAVLQARKQVFEEHGTTNTWGAYQCYGNPDYELRAGGGGRASRAQAKKYVSPREAEIDLWNVASSTHQKMDADYRDWLVQRIESIHERCAESWLDGDPAIQEAFAKAYAELGERALAIEWYARAIGRRHVDEGTRYPGRVFDQWLNLRVREASAAGRGAAVEIRACIADFKRLARVHPTDERYSMIGSAYKHLAQAEGLRARDVASAIRQCAEAYLQAASLSADERGIYNPYPGINALITAQIARWRRVPVRNPAIELDALADALERQLTDAVPTNVWERSFACDLALYRSLNAGTLAEAPVRASLIARYREVEKHASAREFDSVLSQIRFVQQFAPRRLAVPDLLGTLTGNN